MAETRRSPRSSWRRQSTKLALATMLLALVATIPVLPGIKRAAADDLPVHLQAFPTGTPCGYEDSWHAPRGTDANGNPLYHEGVDVIAKTGTPIYAVSDGTITRMSTSNRGGIQLYLTRSDHTYFFHAHLSAYAAGLKVGDTVTAGQLVAYVGQTGDAQFSVPHLHFEVHPGGGAPVNPDPIVKEVDACYPHSTTTPTTPRAGTTTPSVTPPGDSAPSGTPAPPAATPVAPGAATADFGNLAPITPTRFADTRTKLWLHRLVPGETQPLTIAGRNGVPANATMVALNLTVTNPADSGYVVAWPCGRDTPLTSSINFAASETVANAAMVGLGNGKVCLTSKVATDLVVDVSGWQGPGATLRLTPVVPTRLVDTRETRRLTGGETLVVTLPSSPVAARAASFGDAGGATGPESTDTPTGGLRQTDKIGIVATSPPTAAPRDTAATLPPGDTATTAPPNPPTATTSAPPASAPPPATPPVASTSPGAPAPTPGTSTTRPQAVSLNITSVGAAGRGFLTVWPCDAARPTASNLNVAGGDIVPNTVTVGVSAASTVCVYTQSATDVVVDLTGTWSSTAGLSAAPVAPARLLDTRSGGTPMRPGQTLELAVAGVGAVPADVVAVQVNLTATNTDHAGYLTVWPCGNTRPTASNLNPRAGDTVANGATVGLTGGRLCIYASTATHVIVDLTAVMH